MTTNRQNQPGSPRFHQLREWLAWQQTLHPRTIELGLTRLQQVQYRLWEEPPSFTVITVGGTNGKGSCVAFLEAILLAAGYQVGTYTSPHLLHYNERIRIAGTAVSDAELCQAFARIDGVRGEVSLTTFEFTTLAALDIFHQRRLPVVLLEVGLGGRLDAVNLLDADAAIVTSIGIDHVEWLGPDRDSIGYEKAGIYRQDRPAICGDASPPDTLLNQAKTIGARLYQVGKDYDFQRQESHWNWWHGAVCWDSLPLPRLPGQHQLANAAAGLMALQSIQAQLPIPMEAIRTGIAQAYLPGRFQIIPGAVEWVLDVAHNPHGAQALAACLKAHPVAGKTRAIIGMLMQKDSEGIAKPLAKIVDYWYTGSLLLPQGQSGHDLAARLKSVGVSNIQTCSSISAACCAAIQEAAPGDRLLVVGSFHTVAEALNMIRQDQDMMIARY